MVNYNGLTPSAASALNLNRSTWNPNKPSGLAALFGGDQGDSMLNVQRQGGYQMSPAEAQLRQQAGWNQMLAGSGSMANAMSGIMNGALLSGQQSFAPQMQNAMGQIGAGMQNAMSNLANSKRFDAQFNEGNRRWNEMFGESKQQRAADNAYRNSMLGRISNAQGYGGIAGSKTGNSAMDMLMGATAGGAQYFGDATPGSAWGGGYSGWMVPNMVPELDTDKGDGSVRMVFKGYKPAGQMMTNAINQGFAGGGGGGAPGGGYQTMPIGGTREQLSGMGGGNDLFSQLGQTINATPQNPNLSFTQGGQQFGDGGMAEGVPYANTGISTAPGSVWGQSQAGSLGGMLGGIASQAKGMLGNLSPTMKRTFGNYADARTQAVGNDVGRAGTKAEALQQLTAAQASNESQNTLRNLISRLLGMGMDSNAIDAALQARMIGQLYA